MKYILMLLILSIGITSCMTERKCNQRWPIKVLVKDSIVYKQVEVIIYDTLFFAGDTVSTTDTVYIDKATGKITSNKIYTETEFAMAWAQIINNKLFLELIQKDTAIARVLKDNIEIKEVYKTKIVYVNKYIEHWYSKPAYYIAILFLSALLLLVIIKVIKIYTKI